MHVAQIEFDRFARVDDAAQFGYPRAERSTDARVDIEAALDDVATIVPIGEAASLIGLAGSVTTVTAFSI